MLALCRLGYTSQLASDPVMHVNSAHSPQYFCASQAVLHAKLPCCKSAAPGASQRPCQLRSHTPRQPWHRFVPRPVDGSLELVDAHLQCRVVARQECLCNSEQRARRSENEQMSSEARSRHQAGMVLAPHAVSAPQVVHATGHQPFKSRASIWLTSHQGHTSVMNANAQANAEVSSGEWRTKSMPAATAMAAVSTACAADEAAATWRRQYGPRMYSSSDSSSCRGAGGRRGGSG